MGQALRRYYRGATLAAMEEVQTGRRLNYHFDHQGTVQCLTDDTGAVTDRFASDAWGVPVKRTGTSINRQWYVGNLGYYRQVDQALDYVRARYAAVARGQWITEDALKQLHPSLGAYCYGSNAPSARTDPSGLFDRRDWPPGDWPPGKVQCPPGSRLVRADPNVPVWVRLGRGCCTVLRHAAPIAGTAFCLALAYEICFPRPTAPPEDDELFCEHPNAFPGCPTAPDYGLDDLDVSRAKCRAELKGHCDRVDFEFQGKPRDCNKETRPKCTGAHIEVVCHRRFFKPEQAMSILCCPWCNKAPGDRPRIYQSCKIVNRRRRQ